MDMGTFDEIARSVDAIIWDCDHTLLVLDVDWHGYKAALAAQLTGKTADDALFKMVEEFNANGRHDEMIAITHQFEDNAPFVGRDHVIAAVKQLPADLPMAVVSDNLHSTLEHALTGVGIRERFAILIGKDDVQHAKPKGEGVHKALDALRVLPERAVMIGDSWKDESAAAEAGVRFIDVNTIQF